MIKIASRQELQKHAYHSIIPILSQQFSERKADNIYINIIKNKQPNIKNNSYQLQKTLEASSSPKVTKALGFSVR